MRKAGISGKEFMALRKSCGITQAQFGRIAGISRATVCNWEKDRFLVPMWAVIILRLLAAKRQALITGQQSTLEI
jgi:DNA-binding transcriptional regulator YiaG